MAFGSCKRRFALASSAVVGALLALSTGIFESDSPDTAFTFAGSSAPLQLQQTTDAERMPAPLQADPNQWGNLRPLEKKRAPRKPPYVVPHLLNKITRMNREGIKETMQLWGGYQIIIPAMIGHTIALHNGREFIPVYINEGMVGYRLKDFVPTHTFKSHPKQAKVTKYRGR
eukprot:TRINITY_DN309_c0_g3_i1.p1 TRINITY_DN309_c0_g3~~TRINITY_DN309_c0_g3_i1.p1  ORF type:complete len:172 (-),score=41.65 TRINITY_DN309_c0_g3_i1:87-602(-)